VFVKETGKTVLPQILSVIPQILSVIPQILSVIPQIFFQTGLSM
jgi:hypothetical protein